MKYVIIKILGILLLLYSIVYGLTIKTPKIDLVDQTVRNLFYHVPMWFSMIFLLIISFGYSFAYLKHNAFKYDIITHQFNKTAMWCGALGIITGSVWAKFTWGYYWTNDPKLNGVAAGMLIYAGYFILRNSIEDEEKRARLSAAYNLFIFPIFMALILIMPKLAAHSNHPGSGDTVAFSNYDKLDGSLRTVFYPAVIGWIIVTVWLSSINIRIEKLKRKNQKLPL